MTQLYPDNLSITVEPLYGAYPPAPGDVDGFKINATQDEREVEVYIENLRSGRATCHVCTSQGDTPGRVHSFDLTPTNNTEPTALKVALDWLQQEDG